ncbi:MAG: NYN domain-containing protein, partial [Streptosporangiales bacterium]|nr:NYN domain-containing protein [Streptosporangiales bacterium]
PGPLRRIARFEPRRRARLGANPIGVALATDEAFRASVADRVRESDPDLCAAVDAGDVPAAADPVDVAALAYLLRPDGWQRYLTLSEHAVASATTSRAHDEDLARLRAELEETKAEHERELKRLTTRLDAGRDEIRLLRGRIHEERGRTRRAEELVDTARAEAERAERRRAEAASGHEAELRRLRGRLADLEARVEAGRRAARSERGAETARIGVRVDALIEAAQGLRRELALPAGVERPADIVAAGHGTEPAESAPARRDTDPGLLDRLLAAPQSHLLVDGYNVTKLGWPELPLREQRARLLAGLAMLAAQVRTEITCVFDGADLGGRVPVPAARGVRVLFSPAGVTADELLDELVRAEPAGRRLVVVSSDREVAAAVRREGAEPLDSAVLVDRLVQQRRT